MPWPMLREDLKHFKATTLNQTAIMGSATLKSIGKALPNRRNFVLTTQKDLDQQYAGITVVYGSSLKTIIKNELLFQPDRQYYVVGGQDVYRQLVDECDRLLVTEIDAEFECDRTFTFNESEFEVTNEFFHPQSSENPLPFTIREYVRKK